MGIVFSGFALLSAGVFFSFIFNYQHINIYLKKNNNNSTYVYINQGYKNKGNLNIITEYIKNLEGTV